MEAFKIPIVHKIVNEEKLSCPRRLSVSYRPKHKPYFYVTGKTVDSKVMWKKDVAMIDVHEDPAAFTVNTWCKIDPCDDVHIHAGVQGFAACEEDSYVIHLHGTTNILSYTCLLHHIELNSIKRYFPEIPDYRIGSNIPYESKYETDHQNIQLAEVVTNTMNVNDLVVLENHGLVAKGKNYEDVLQMITELDYYCGIAVHDDVRMYHS